ncbi:hypothetical protein GMORB2_0360 [Geosmithia morbida]|uniref:SH3 domain-containing protein n=1 Tax=Geosmithia morbida TaxID=1094350 RepID=A0A9P4Z393_9HYPO|nr:uncharacterized protein GMORB2_0360 [Geosmithia morbida]KAF4126624.1 hypothetical protein GMORB2_0360 [Geosmithia morbida]
MSVSEVDDLILHHFRLIADKARQAVGDAGSHNVDMIKAAKALLKEGDRAVSNIEPLCTKYLEEFGPVFTFAVKDNTIISQHRAILTELLWEFDDLIQPEDVDAYEFAKLKHASRKAALATVEALKCMKLEAAASSSPRGSVSKLPTPPMLHAAVARSGQPTGGLGGSHGHSHQSSSPSSNVAMADVHDATAQPPAADPSAPSTDHMTMDWQDSRDRGRPRSPVSNPWDLQKMPPTEGAPPPSSQADWDINQRASEDEPPILPAAWLITDAASGVAVIRPPPPGDGDYRPGYRDGSVGDRRMSIASSSCSAHSDQHDRPRHTRPRHETGLSSFSIPKDKVEQQHVSPPYVRHPGPASPVAGPPPSAPNPLSSLPPIPASKHMYVRRDSAIESPISPTGPTPLSPTVLDVPTKTQQLPILPGFVGSLPGPEGTMSQLPEVVPYGATLPIDTGLIPVETGAAPARARVVTDKQKEEARILADSSIALCGGFCEGTNEVIRGRIGVKRLRKPAIVTTAEVARCNHCLYELDFARIEADVDRHDQGNSTMSGINYRIRFLQKSHLTVKRIDDVQFGCVFCAQQGHTLDKSDATVFFSGHHLFDHLARHPRPLPAVPGMTVIEGDTVPDKHYNDYDIHFRNPPLPHPVLERIDGVGSSMPTGISKEQSRRLFGQRLLPDRSPALQVAKGARITSLRWPDRYNGEWCFGWHEGTFASIPFDIVRLEVPPSDEIRYDRQSLVTAKAKWRFSVKDKEYGDWLKFDKNETISNLCWVDRDYWCWSGTNEKNKSGIFPQAFINTNTIMEPTEGVQSRITSLREEQARSSSIMSKFSWKNKYV